MDTQEVYEYYNNNHTIDETGEHFGLTRHQVREMFAKAGLPVRSRGHRVKPRVDALDDAALVAFKAQWDMLESTVKGTIAEGYVKNKLSELGFDVWEPVTQNHATDLVILSQRNVIRLQVKTATYDLERKRFRANLSRHRRSQDYVPYDDDFVDYFVVFCAGLPSLEFYVVPARLVKGQPSINLLPHRPKVRTMPNSWEEYRNAFDLLRQNE